MEFAQVLVLTWNSVVGRRTSAWDSRYVFTLLPYRLMVSRQTLWDLLKIFCWSVQIATGGVFPLVDHLGNPWHKNSWRARMVGKPLAGA